MGQRVSLRCSRTQKTRPAFVQTLWQDGKTSTGGGGTQIPGWRGRPATPKTSSPGGALKGCSQGEASPSSKQPGKLVGEQPKKTQESAISRKPSKLFRKERSRTSRTKVWPSSWRQRSETASQAPQELSRAVTQTPPGSQSLPRQQMETQSWLCALKMPRPKLCPWKGEEAARPSVYLEHTQEMVAGPSHCEEVTPPSSRSQKSGKE